MPHALFEDRTEVTPSEENGRRIYRYRGLRVTTSRLSLNQKKSHHHDRKDNEQLLRPVLAKHDRGSLLHLASIASQSRVPQCERLTAHAGARRPTRGRI